LLFWLIEKSALLRRHPVRATGAADEMGQQVRPFEAPVEAVLELGEVARHVVLGDRLEGPGC
jgi:hypothetical protein